MSDTTATNPPSPAPAPAPTPATAVAEPKVPVAEVQHIYKAFADETGHERTVLEDISLAVGSGEVVCILGESGCGKSTLMRILVGLIPQTKGAILCHGKPLEGLHPGSAIV